MRENVETPVKARRSRGANLSTSDKCIKGIKAETARITGLRKAMAKKEVRSGAVIRTFTSMKACNQREKDTLRGRLPFLFPDGRITGGVRTVLSGLKCAGFETLNYTDLAEVLLEGGYERRSGTEWVCSASTPTLPPVPSANPLRALLPKKAAKSKVTLHDFSKDEVQHLVSGNMISGMVNVTLGKIVLVDTATAADCIEALGPPPCGTKPFLKMTQYIYDFHGLNFNSRGILASIVILK